MRRKRERKEEGRKEGKSDGSGRGRNGPPPSLFRSATGLFRSPASASGGDRAEFNVGAFPADTRRAGSSSRTFSSRAHPLSLSLSLPLALSLPRGRSFPQPLFSHSLVERSRASRLSRSVEASRLNDSTLAVESPRRAASSLARFVGIAGSNRHAGFLIHATSGDNVRDKIGTRTSCARGDARIVSFPSLLFRAGRILTRIRGTVPRRPQSDLLSSDDGG